MTTETMESDDRFGPKSLDELPDFILERASLLPQAGFNEGMSREVVMMADVVRQVVDTVYANWRNTVLSEESVSTIWGMAAARSLRNAMEEDGRGGHALDIDSEESDFAQFVRGVIEKELKQTN
jgi:hypothetical protein